MQLSLASAFPVVTLDYRYPNTRVRVKLYAAVQHAFPARPRGLLLAMDLPRYDALIAVHCRRPNDWQHLRRGIYRGVFTA